MRFTAHTQAQPALAFVAILGLSVITSGCNSKPASIPAATTSRAAPQIIEYPPRPATPPPPFKLFHHDASSITLVTADNASDQQVEAILYQLHDAARTHTFDALHIPQKLVDARSPIIWFHIYRGDKCADEKYTSGPLPCGDSYHAAGDYTLGSFANPDRDSAVLLESNGRELQLWNPDATANSPGS